MLSQVSVSGSNIHIDISSLMSRSSDLPGNRDRRRQGGVVALAEVRTRESGRRPRRNDRAWTVQGVLSRDSSSGREEDPHRDLDRSPEPLEQDKRQPGRELYLAKQKEVLAGETHLVEIDLLRSGTHTSAVPKELAEAKAGPFDYHISIYRFDRPKDFLIYPIRMEERLPAIGIPLLPGDADVPLDVQATFDRAYDAGRTGERSITRRTASSLAYVPNKSSRAARLIKATE